MYDPIYRHGETRVILELKERIRELEEENKKLKELCKTVE